MLVEFKVRNFLSFKDMQVLRMRRKDKEGIESGSDCAFIYGPNSSGKSNLIKAMDFSKNLILGKIVKNDYQPFCDLYGKPYTEKPTYFEYRIRINGITYSYGFEIDLVKRSEILKRGNSLELKKNLKSCIVSEWLYDVSNPKAKKIWEYIYTDGSSRKNNSVNRNGLSKHLNDRITNWLKNNLMIRTSEPEMEITPVTKDFIKRLGWDLYRFDTGISDIDLVKFDNQSIPQNIIKKCRDDLSEECQLVTVYGNKKKRNWLIFADRKKDDWIFYEVLFRHHSDYKAHIEEESVGTRKIIQLLSLLSSLETSGEKGTLVIDEIECSIHTLIMKEYVKMFKSPKYSGSQLIFTTHESRLLSDDISDIEDVWFIDNTINDEEKSSSLYSLKSFNGTIKKIDNMYLDGRFSAIPVFTPIRFGDDTE